jgi:hypothetical protein
MGRYEISMHTQVSRPYVTHEFPGIRLNQSRKCCNLNRVACEGSGLPRTSQPRKRKGAI